MEKRLELALLIDFYGPLLTEHRLNVVRLYVDEDLSYQEIADQLGITRQGVHDAIRSAQEQLARFEQALGLARRYAEIRREVAACREHLAGVHADEATQPLLEQAKQALGTIEWIER